MIASNHWSRVAMRYLVMTIASAGYAISFNFFFAQNQIGFGGITGISQVINAVFGMPPTGVLIILFNIPLFIVGWRLLGGELLVSSLYTMAISSLFIDVIDSLYTFPTIDPLLAAVYGGVSVGACMGFIFLVGATTGGSDIGARLLKLKFEWLPLGRIILGIDLLVICASALAFNNLNSALYGIISLYISSLTIDGVLYGMDTSKVALIISDSPTELAHMIIKDMSRGVTILDGRGGYSGAEKKVLMCAFKKRQIVEIRRIVKEFDPAAFLIVFDAHEVLGDGFGKYTKNAL